MPKPIHQIKTELEAIEADIPQFIKTGIPKNIKSDKHRSLETRANEADQDILDHIELLQDNMGMVISGFGDPNEYPPPEDYAIGQLYMRQNQSTNENLDLWIFTGVNGIGWWKYQDFNSGVAKRYYATIENPNEEPIPTNDPSPQGNQYKIGDFYVETTTGTSAGNVLSVWMFLKLQTGDQWINLSGGSGSQLPSLSWLDLISERDVIPFPAMSKGDALVVRTYEDGTNTQTDGWATIGGWNGVKVANNGMIICMQDSAGGTYSAVGHKYAIVGNSVSKQQILRFGDKASFPDDPDAEEGVLYLAEDSGILYFWSRSEGDYMPTGSITPGTLINSTTFEDSNNNTVTPDDSHLYHDTTTNIYYRWNGVKYESILNGAGSQIYFFLDINDGQPAVLTRDMPAEMLYVNKITGSIWVWTGSEFVRYGTDEFMVVCLNGTDELELKNEVFLGVLPCDMRVVDVKAYMYEAPTGSLTKVRLMINDRVPVPEAGSGQSAYLEIPSGDRESNSLSTHVGSSYQRGDRIKVDVAQIASSPGKGLSIYIKYKRV